MSGSRSGSSTPAATAARAKLLRVQEVADRLGCSVPNVNRLRKAGKMPPPMKIGNLVRWSPDLIDAWLAGDGRRGSISRPVSVMDRLLASMAASDEPFIAAMGKAFLEHGERFAVAETLLAEPATQAQDQAATRNPIPEVQS